MLVLSRKLGEKIKIGDDITLIVVDISHNKIRLGIEAPKSTSVFREELTKAKSNQEVSDPTSAR
jgi:carbon storage regulator